MLLLETKRKSGHLGIIHFTGIGGIGMSGIAEIMYNLGYIVQGSDLSDNTNTKRLINIGIKVFKGHDRNHIRNISYIVVSSAISNDNIEIRTARERKIPIIKRAEILAELMRSKYSIAVSGSHGKTTTTSLIACMFESANLAPTVINGGVTNYKMASAYIGKGKYLIAEADESDGTFINIPATVAVITNIDNEHVAFYKDFKNLVSAFKTFIRKLPFYGFAVLCIDHPVVREISNNVTERRIITYGIESEDANIRAYNIKSNISSSNFDIKINLPDVKGTILIEDILIPTPGKHNVLNSLAAIAISTELNFGIKTIKTGLSTFAGVKRRFTRICEYNGAEIIDDYAHHPVEIKATLATAKSIAKQRKGKVIAIFQPHRYSRIRDLFYDFSTCFSDSEKLCVLNIYGAGEVPINGITSQALIKEITKSGLKAEFIDNHNDICDFIKSNANQGDLIVMMGAGTISDLAYQLLDKLISN